MRSKIRLNVDGKDYPLSFGIGLDPKYENGIIADSEYIKNVQYLINENKQNMAIIGGKSGILEMNLKCIPELVEELRDIYEVYKR